MGRRRKTHKHLPRHMLTRHGRFYYVARIDGRQRWIPLGAEYAEALRQWSALEGKTIHRVTTVDDALIAYLQDRVHRLSPRTMVGYRQQATTLAAVFGKMRLEDVTQAMVYTYLRKRANVAGNRERDLLRAVYNHAGNLGYTGPNPCQGMHYRNPEPPRQRYLTDNELAALVLAAKPRLANLILFLFLTAMRVSDAIALPLTAADAEGIHWREGKTRRPRFVEWSGALREVWKAAAGARIGQQCVFRGQRGPYTLDGLESSWRRVRIRAGVPDARLHDIRAKAASDLPLEHAQKLLGHASPGITQKHYRRKADGVKPTR